MTTLESIMRLISITAMDDKSAREVIDHSYDNEEISYGEYCELIRWLSES